MTKLEDLKVGDKVKIIAYDIHDEGDEDMAKKLIGNEGIIVKIFDGFPYPLKAEVCGVPLLLKPHEVKLIEPDVKVVFT